MGIQKTLRSAPGWHVVWVGRGLRGRAALWCASPPHCEPLALPQAPANRRPLRPAHPPAPAPAQACRVLQRAPKVMGGPHLRGHCRPPLLGSAADDPLQHGPNGHVFRSLKPRQHERRPPTCPHLKVGFVPVTPFRRTSRVEWHVLCLAEFCSFSPLYSIGFLHGEAGAESQGKL
jgi:hypothetical protein